jgi:lipopolysaccharide transport system ATP-binding protein
MEENHSISVRSLSKRYRIGEQQRAHGSLRETIADVAHAAITRLRRIGQERSPDTVVWALNGVSFDIPQGQIVGVIGSNGAGKSTLLKLMSRITEPTLGTIRLRGRVGALLEVGTGFHHELTGRENIFLSGAILGMRRSEIRARFDEIVAFAEIGRYLDTPVKKYSSGMYVRLAFAVAAHLEPEILLVDEVLAVGDTAFQRKCLGRMSDVAHSGRTVVFVSHNMEAITSLCDRAMLLEGGELTAIGTPAEVITRYLESIRSKTEAERPVVTAEPDPNKEGQILSVTISGSGSANGPVYDLMTPIQVTIDFELRRYFENILIGFQVRRSDGFLVLSSGDADYTNFAGPGLIDQIPRRAGRYQAQVELPAPLLNTGLFEIVCVLTVPRNRVVDAAEGIMIEVVEAEGGSFASYLFKSRRQGLLAIPIPWTIEQLCDLDADAGEP